MSISIIIIILIDIILIDILLLLYIIILIIIIILIDREGGILFPLSSRFSSISLTRRPIMQGQRPRGNPPFARKIFASGRAYACEVISRVYAKRTRKIALYIYVRTPCQHSNWRANTLATGRFFTIFS